MSVDLHVIDGDLPDSIPNIIPGTLLHSFVIKRSSDCGSCRTIGRKRINCKNRGSDRRSMARRLLWFMYLL